MLRCYASHGSATTRALVISAYALPIAYVLDYSLENGLGSFPRRERSRSSIRADFPGGKFHCSMLLWSYEWYQGIHGTCIPTECFLPLCGLRPLRCFTNLVSYKMLLRSSVYMRALGTLSNWSIACILQHEETLWCYGLKFVILAFSKSSISAKKFSSNDRFYEECNVKDADVIAVDFWTASWTQPKFVSGLWSGCSLIVMTIVHAVEINP